MEASVIPILTQLIFGGGGLVALISAIILWLKYPLEKKSSKLDHSKVTVDIALSTLDAVNTQYKEVLNRQVELERDVKKLKDQFEEQKSLVSKLKDYILYVFDNWESIRHNPNPPKLTTDIHLQIFKEDEE